MSGEDPTARRSLVQRAAASVGEAWARAWLEELAAERRAAIGGWPGTLSQARARVRPAIDAELARARLPAAAIGEIEEGARGAYARARVLWLASAKADDAQDDAGDEEVV